MKTRKKNAGKPLAKSGAAALAAPSPLNWIGRGWRKGSLWCEARVEQWGAQYRAFSLFVLFIMLTPHGLWFETQPAYHLHVLLWRFSCGVLCAVLLMHTSLPARAQRSLPVAWYMAVTWCVPATVTYMLWHSGLSANWMGAALAALATLGVLVDTISVAVVCGTGGLLGTVIYGLHTGGLHVPAAAAQVISWVQFAGLAVCTVVALALFSRNQARLHAEREDAYRVLSGRLGHEMRTPLSSMLGEAQCALTNLDTLQDLLRQAKLADAGAALLNELRESCQAIARVAEATLCMVEMLLMNLKDKPDANFNIERCSMHACVEAALSEYPYRFSERSRVIWRKGTDFFFSASLVPVKHVVFNLLRNALTYVRFQGGRVTLECEVKGGWGLLHIWDNGPGIAPDVQAHLFDRFRSGTAGGTGLGLHLCKYLAICFGGDISVQSELGVGTRFTVRFPLI
ncbi:MAG: HAMP domain-containing sensor histidine kinase [Myxococcota bacterium]